MAAWSPGRRPGCRCGKAAAKPGWLLSAPFLNGSTENDAVSGAWAVVAASRSMKDLVEDPEALLLEGVGTPRVDQIGDDYCWAGPSISSPPTPSLARSV